MGDAPAIMVCGLLSYDPCSQMSTQYVNVCTLAEMTEITVIKLHVMN